MFHVFFVYKYNTIYIYIERERERFTTGRYEMLHTELQNIVESNK